MLAVDKQHALGPVCLRCLGGRGGGGGCEQGHVLTSTCATGETANGRCSDVEGPASCCSFVLAVRQVPQCQQSCRTSQQLGNAQLLTTTSSDQTGDLCAVDFVSRFYQSLQYCVDIAGCVLSSASWEQLRLSGHQRQWQVHYTQTSLQVKIPFAETSFAERSLDKKAQDAFC